MLYESHLAEYLTDSKPRIFNISWLFFSWFPCSLHYRKRVQYFSTWSIPWLIPPIRDPFQILLKLKHESSGIYVISYSIFLAQQKTNQER